MKIVKKGLVAYKRLGIKGGIATLKKRGQIKDKDYMKWYENNKPTPQILTQQREKIFNYNPMISIVVPVYNTPLSFLTDMIDSVKNQSYTNWELCIANADPANQDVHDVLEQYMEKDKRIKSVDVPENLGIAENTNQAIQISSGEYIGLLDHDDRISLDALYEVVKCLNEKNKPEVIYSDEDKITIDGEKHYQPNFKPEFNLDMLRSNNYICHFLIIKRSLLINVGGLDGEYNGAQDHDLIFRCIEKTNQIVRIPKILYHWRMHQRSTADNPESKKYANQAGIKAIEAHLRRCGENGIAEMTEKPGFYRIKYPFDIQPAISVVIANCSHKKISCKVLRKLVGTYDSEKVEICIVDKDKKETRYNRLKKRGINIRIIPEKNENRLYRLDKGIKNAREEYVLCLSPYIRRIGENYLAEYVANIIRHRVGIVTGKLYYPNSTIKNAGMIIREDGKLNYLFEGLPKGCNGYMNRQSMQQNVSIVSLEDTMIRKSLWPTVGMGKHDSQMISVLEEWCSKVREKGNLIVYTPYADAYSNERNLRGYVKTIKEFNNNPNLRDNLSL